MKPFSLLVKPASADCNLRCAYCFYLDKCALYPGVKQHRMTDAVLTRMIAGYMATVQAQYAFGWQGGEPTLMGVDFFQRVTNLQQKHGRAGAVVANGLQTNGVLIDEAFAAHFAEYNFLLGVSLDGPADIHDHFRLRADGGATHADVMAALTLLNKHHVQFNILVLVSSANVERGREVYTYLCEHGFLHHQYIPCVEFDEHGAPLPFSISGEQWGEFLCELYDAWHPADTHRVSIRYFDSILTWLVDGFYNICHMGHDCRQYFVVEHNGDVYPCDFFVRPELLLGNIREQDWPELQTAPRYRAFGAQKARAHADCAQCEFFTLCAADCLKHRLYSHNDPRTLSWLCTGHRRFFRHALSGFKKLASGIRRERRCRSVGDRAAQTPSRPTGRNAPCPCGSGKKHKNCCGH